MTHPRDLLRSTTDPQTAADALDRTALSAAGATTSPPWSWTRSTSRRGRGRRRRGHRRRDIDSDTRPRAEAREGCADEHRLPSGVLVSADRPARRRGAAAGCRRRRSSRSCGSGCGSAERAFADVVDALTAAGGGSFSAIPPFAAVVREGDGARIAVRGRVRARVVGSAVEHEITGAEVTTWSERFVPAVTGAEIVVEDTRGRCRAADRGRRGPRLPSRIRIRAGPGPGP